MGTQQVASGSSVLRNKVESQRTTSCGVGVSSSIIVPVVHMSPMGKQHPIMTYVHMAT
jgi:hypothetical protein